MWAFEIFAYKFLLFLNMKILVEFQETRYFIILSNKRRRVLLIIIIIFNLRNLHLFNRFSFLDRGVLLFDYYSFI